MKKDALSKIQSALETKIQKAGKTSPTAQLRISNIRWIEKLPRKGLSYQKKERQLLIHTTRVGEKIFIQYPGKESRKYKKDGKKGKKTAIRPWDFRPEIYLPGNKGRHKSMSFFDIWAVIFETAEKLIKKKRENTLRMFAILLYRMAFMHDHIKVKPFKTWEVDVVYRKNNRLEFSRKRKKQHPALFKFNPNEQVLKYIAKECPQWGDMSLEAFLFYNELLAWNEDCKYYYRNYHVRDTGEWIRKTGRVNTLLTHIRILGYILQDVSLASIFSDFSTRRGISAASDGEITQICRDIVKKG